MAGQKRHKNMTAMALCTRSINTQVTELIKFPSHYLANGKKN